MTIDVFRPTGLRFSHSWAECLRVGHKLGRVTLTGLHAVASDMCSFALFETSVEPLGTPLILMPATTMLATNVTKDSTLSNKKFALCLCSLLRPSLALSPCEFATCMRALISSPVPTSIRQCCSRLGQPALPITGLTSRAFRRLLPDNILHLAVRGYLMLPNLRVIEYSDDFLFWWLLLLLETVI